MSKIAKLAVSMESFLEFFKSGERHYRIDKGIPEDAQFVGTEYDSFRNIWLIKFTSGSLEDVQVYDEIPVFSIEITYLDGFPQAKLDV